jgi:hypothetical protein
LVRSSGRYSNKNSAKADLYEITLETLQRGIREKRDFGVHIKDLSETYDPHSMDYTVNFFDNVNTLKKFIEQNAFANTTNVLLDNNSLNFICYIISKGLNLLTKTCCIMSVYAKKKNIQVNNFKYACDIHFSGELGTLIKQRVSEIEGLLMHRKEQKVDNNDNNDNNDNEDNKENEGDSDASDASDASDDSDDSDVSD